MRARSLSATASSSRASASLCCVLGVRLSSRWCRGGKGDGTVWRAVKGKAKGQPRVSGGAWPMGLYTWQAQACVGSHLIDRPLSLTHLWSSVMCLTCPQSMSPSCCRGCSSRKLPICCGGGGAMTVGFSGESSSTPTKTAVPKGQSTHTTPHHITWTQDRIAALNLPALHTPKTRPLKLFFPTHPGAGRSLHTPKTQPLKLKLFPTYYPGGGPR